MDNAMWPIIAYNKLYDTRFIVFYSPRTMLGLLIQRPNVGFFLFSLL